MDPEAPEVTSPWDRLDLPRQALIEYGADALFPSDDKMVDVWLALHGDKISIQQEAAAWTQNTKSTEENELYGLITKLLIERAKKYGSLERP
jgi:hypothetical protein